MQSDLSRTHAAIFALHQEMKADREFRRLCEQPARDLPHGLPWNFEDGYEPRWYNGPAPEDVQVLFLMAEPGAPTKTEKECREKDPEHAAQPVNHEEWLAPYRDKIKNQEHYWRENLRALCRHIWPDETEANMYRYLGGSCTFWMSLPEKQTTPVPRDLEDYFLKNYLRRFLQLFPNAVLLAAGSTKPRTRLERLKRLAHAEFQFECCWAFTKPACTIFKQRAEDSWRQTGRSIRSKLEGQQSRES